MKKIAILLIFTLFSFSSFSTTWYYQTGDVALVSNWDSQADGLGGSSPANFTTTTDVFDLNGKTVSVLSSWDLSGILTASSPSILTSSSPNKITLNGPVTNASNIDGNTSPFIFEIEYGYIGATEIISGQYTFGIVLKNGVIGTAVGDVDALNLVTLGTAILDMGTHLLQCTTTNISGSGAPGDGTIKTQNTSAAPIIISGGIVCEPKVVYNATGAQSVLAFDYQGGLSIEGGGSSIKTAAGNLIIGTSLNIALGTKLALGTNTMTEGTPALSSITGRGSMETKNLSTNPFPSGKNWDQILVLFAGASGSAEYLPGGTYWKLGQVVPGNTLSARGDVSVFAEIADLQGTIDMGVHALSGNFSFNNFSTSTTLRTANTSGAPFPSGKTFTVGSTVEFYANADQTIPAGTYENLTLTGTSNTTKTTGGDLTVNKVLTVEGTLTALKLEHQLTAGASFSTSKGSGTGGLLEITSLSPAGALPASKTWDFSLSFDKSGYDIPALTMVDKDLGIRANATLVGDLTLSGAGSIEFFGANTTLNCVTNSIHFGAAGLAEDIFGTAGKIQTQAATDAFTGTFIIGTNLLVEFNAAGVQHIPGGTYRGGLSALNTSAKTFTGNVTAAGPLNVTTSIDASSFQLIEESGLTLTITGSGQFYTSNNSSTPVPADLDWSSLAEFQYRTGTTTIVSGIYSSLALNGTGTRTTAGSSTCADLILSSANETLIVSADDYIIENSSGVIIIDASSKIVLEADNSGNYGQLKATAFNSSSGSGKVEKQFYFSPSTGRWHNIGTGLIGADLQDIAESGTNFNFSPFAANGDGSAFKWNATNSNWETAAATGNAPENGINVFAGPGATGSVFLTTTGTVSLSGSAKTSDAVITLSYDNGAGSNTTQTAGVGSADWGWNFIANPYTSSYDWDLQTIPTDVYNAIYIWTGSNYASYVKGAGSGNNGGTQYIAPAQGFWVQTNSTLGASTVDLTLTNANTTVVASPSYLKTNPDGIKLNIADSNPEHADQLTIVFNHQSTEGFDGKYDAHKLLNLGDVPNIWTQSEAHGYSINSSPNSVDRFAVHVADKNENEQMTFSIEDEDLKSYNYVFIEDLKTNTFKELSNGGTYSFTHDVNFGTERFQLHFGKTQHEILARVENRLKAYFSSSALMLNLQSSSLSDVDITLADLQGRTIVNETRAFASEISIDNLPELSTGVYLLSVSQKGQSLGILKIMR